MGKLIDLTGQTFGLWTVMEKGTVKKTSSGSIVYWKCKCDCGQIKEVRGADLKNGKSTSCGCSRKEGVKNLAGLRFGRLIVQCQNGKDKYNNIIWKCVCDCGMETNVVSTLLRQGKTQSCGCLQRERTGETHRKDITGQRFGKWTVLQRHALQTPGKHTFWDCRCDCGNIVAVNIANLLNGSSQSCGCENSRGERIISMLLTENNISYQKEKTFLNLVSDKGYPLRYDFYVNEKYIIEFDGIQHFQTFDWNGGQEGFERTKLHDKIKNKFCFDNNIPLIRIPYTHLSKLCLEDLLLATSNFIVKPSET